MAAPSPVVVELTWTGGLMFATTVNKSSFTQDSAATAGPSPVELLAAGLAGCMAIDLIHILTKGRQPPAGVTSRLVGHRAADDPKRFVRFELQFTVDGAVPSDAIARAIALSREKYCSVWHSLRQDTELSVTFDQRPASGA